MKGWFVLLIIVALLGIWFVANTEPTPQQPDTDIERGVFP